jgi:hypothetical protein
MKMLERRLQKLESSFGGPVEAAFSLRLQKRIEAGRQRLAAGMAQGQYAPQETVRDTKARPRTVVAILQSGRQRNSRADKTGLPST